MGQKVFANCNEVSAKSGDGKVIACFPDVCLSPPSPPAGPVPIPYPVSSFSSDTTDGSKSVKIHGKEIMLKDKSYFSKCTGDEAATKSLGMGVVSHNITGKVYFAAWSMDVKVEGLNVDRHLDLTTSNHMSPGSNTATIQEMENADKPVKKECDPPCPYDRDKCPQTPTTDQTALVNKKGAKCWRRGCLTPTAGPFIADHQPSLSDKWAQNGGCNDARFCEKATSTRYHRLKSRCPACFHSAYGNVGKKSASGKDLNEGLMEAGKSRKHKKKHEEQFGVKIKPKGARGC